MNSTYLGQTISVLLVASILSIWQMPVAGAQSDWTEWYNRDTPDATGDYENLDYFTSIGEACEAPIDIECQDAATGEDYTAIGQVYSCTPDRGGICVNADQADGICRNYQVRFDCGTLITRPPIETGSNLALIGGLIGAGLLLIFGVAVLTHGGAGKSKEGPKGNSGDEDGPKLKAVQTAPPSAAQTPETRRKPAQSGLIFPGSTLQGVSTTGGSPGNLSSFSGSFAPLMPTNQATGRIGYRQKGIPQGEDVAFGTGVLISDRHILTNRHVVEAYRDAIEAGGVGIEFFGEIGSDASEFVPFKASGIEFPTGLDLAILRLETAPKDRTPVALLTISDTLEGRDIAVIGYPDPIERDEAVLALVETPPVFAVKRVSTGKIFRHSSDTDQVFGVEAPVGQLISESGTVPALCHNASTLGGSSGSPVIDLETGEILGLHFGYDIAFNWAEPANFALPINVILNALKRLDLKT